MLGPELGRGPVHRERELVTVHRAAAPQPESPADLFGSALERCTLTWADESVDEEGKLHPVNQAELGEDPRNVTLTVDRRMYRESAICWLDSPAATDSATSRSRSVSILSHCRGCWGRPPAAMKVSTSRPVTSRDRTVSPREAARSLAHYGAWR